MRREEERERERGREGERCRKLSNSLETITSIVTFALALVNSMVN